MIDLQAALLEHPRIEKARVAEHVFFNTDDMVGVCVTVKKRPGWCDNVVLRTYIDREIILDDPDWLISYLLNTVDEWVEGGAPS